MKEILAAIEKLQADFYFYWGPISKTGYHQLSACIEAQTTSFESAYLILTTYGGDPNAGYRIARALGHHYQKVTILIPDVCKSAGTLICIGANELILGDRGELGPLDIQLSKPDEMFENMSGLDILQALNALQNQVLDSFRSYWLDIKAGSQISTRMAADIATRLAEGYIAPIASKIDPVTLGEHQRAVQIAFDYGERLNTKSESLKHNALIKLVSSYPSHGFVIDRKEAQELFKCVSAPKGEQIMLYDWARALIESRKQPADPFVFDLRTILQPKEDANHEQLYKKSEFDHVQNREENIPNNDDNSVSKSTKNK